jgi:hypothetical protein
MKGQRRKGANYGRLEIIKKESRSEGRRFMSEAASRWDEEKGEEGVVRVMMMGLHPTQVHRTSDWEPDALPLFLFLFLCV